jgi:hypothetical protein
MDKERQALLDSQ